MIRRWAIQLYRYGRAYGESREIEAETDAEATEIALQGFNEDDLHEITYTVMEVVEL